MFNGNYVCFLWSCDAVSIYFCLYFVGPLLCRSSCDGVSVYISRTIMAVKINDPKSLLMAADHLFGAEIITNTVILDVWKYRT